MPELAEVETLKRYLKKHITGEKIISFTQKRKNLRYPLDKNLKTHAISGKVTDVVRSAKFLSLTLDNSYSIIFHLGMSGRLTIQSKNYQLQKHDHVIIGFQSNRQLVFNDVRRFGMVYSCNSNALARQDFLKSMGQEPLAKEFNTDYLLQKLSSRKSPIKTAIMNSKIVVGVGNIYAAESLFVAKMSPFKRSNTLTILEVDKLVDAIKTVLQKAIKAGGTTLKDFVGGDNKPGYFKQELNVYDREGKWCYICKHPIQKIRQAGRSTYFCVNCQK